MKAVMPSVPPDIVAWRRRTGADRWDEMWEGVLHMPPMPNADHQDLEGAMEHWLRARWAPARGARVYHQINVASPGGWPNDYRIPDLVILRPDRFGIDRNEYFEGGPSVVVEIHSPGDEAYEKLDFYAKIGVPEVWIVERDSKRPEIHALVEGRYAERPAGQEGWIRSEETGIELRGSGEGKLALRIAGDASSEEELPTR